MNTAERKIFAAHKKAGQYCVEGLDPTSALIKAANLDELNPEMTRRVSEMLNISLTKSFMKSASDKTASFPLADCEKAIKEVFAGEVHAKTAAVLSDLNWELEGKSLSITRKIDTSNDHSLFKVAKTETKEDINHLVKQAEGAKDLLRAEISKRAQDLLSAEAKALRTYTDIISHFRQNAYLPQKFAQFEERCYSEYGLDVGQYLDSIHVQLNEGTDRGDSDSHKKAFYFEPDSANLLFDSLMNQTDQISKQASELVIAKAAFGSFDSQINQFYKQALGGKPEVAGCAGDMIDLSKKKADFSLLSDPRLEAAIASRGQQGSESFTKGLEAAQNRIYKRPGDETDMEMDNVRRQAILADLMSNDDIISGQEPGNVQSAYNTLLSISPRSTLHREVVRSVLRNATAAQAIDPFTAKQLADLEGQHLKNEKIEKGQMAVSP